MQPRLFGIFAPYFHTCCIVRLMKIHFQLLVAATCLAALPHTALLAQITRKPAPKPVARPAAKPAPKAVNAAKAPAAAPAPAVRAASTSSSAAVAGPFGVGTNVVNLGIGVGNRYVFGTGSGSSVSPAISVSFERGIMEIGPGVLGVGAFVGYQGASYDLGSGFGKYSYTDVIVTIRGAFHYPVSEALDAYGGLGIGVRRAGVSYEGSNAIFGTTAVSSTGVASGLFVGGRYFFTSAIGAFAELGYDQTYLKVGLTAKF